MKEKVKLVMVFWRAKNIDQQLKTTLHHSLPIKRLPTEKYLVMFIQIRLMDNKQILILNTKNQHCREIIVFTFTESSLPQSQDSLIFFFSSSFRN